MNDDGGEMSGGSSAKESSDENTSTCPYSDALAAFAQGLAVNSKSVALLVRFIETTMKSPLRGSFEPIYRQLQAIKIEKSPFVITSLVGQEILANGQHGAAIIVLESALKIGSCSLKLKSSVLSALSSAYWAVNNVDRALVFMQRNLKVVKQLGDTVGECQAYGNIGSAHFARGQFTEALAAHRYQLMLAMKGWSSGR